MKRLLSLLLLIGCGDDLGWDQKADHDCPEVQDAEQDVADLDDTPDSSGGGDVDGGDAVDVGGLEDLGDVGDAQDVTEVVDADQVPDLPDAQTQDQDVAPTDIQDQDLPTQDSVSLPPECTEASDCPAPTPCVMVWCSDEGACQQDKELLDNVPCDTDQNGCTLEKCLGGLCLSAGLKFCDDLDACTTDTCDQEVGCLHIPIPPCDDNQLCTDDSCDPALGCQHINNTTPCSDGVGCTDGDACKDGACLPGDPTACDDQNPCTDDVCDVLSDCQNLPNQVTCTDGNACTQDDVCGGGVCVGGTVNCNDANLCTDDSCAPTIGCEHEPNLDGCQDGNPCTDFDMCEAGVCMGGTGVSCDDGNGCTVDVCDLTVGCTSTDAPAGTPCSQGYCLNGACSCKAFGCAAPKFLYSGDVTAGMLGGMGGGVGPKMGCATTDVLIGIGFDFSSSNKTVTRTTVVCGKVEADQNGTVKTTQTTTQKSGGSGCYGWDPAPSTPLVTCPPGWVIVGIEGKNASGTLFHSVSVTCAKMDVGGKPTGTTQTIPIPATNAAGGTPKSVMCPAGTVARYFETRAGCGQDALTLYCAASSPDCTGQPPICTE